MKKYLINSTILILILTIGIIIGHSIGQADNISINTEKEIEFDTSTDCNSEMIRLLNKIYNDIRIFKETGPPFSEYSIIEFNKKGFEDPVEEIISDLRKKTELIPISGVLGGTMYFGRIRIISTNRAVAYFEDGHIGGIALYSYEAESPDEIYWKLVFSSEGKPNYHENWLTDSEK